MTLTLAILFSPIARAADPPAIVAVLEFDASGLDDPGGLLPDGLGEGVAEMITDELVNRGGLVVERARLDAVLKERQMIATGAFEGEAARSLGKLLGADLLVLGSVASFGNETTETRASRSTSKLFHGVDRLKKQTRETVVDLRARLIDTRTGTIVASVDGHGQDVATTVSTSGSERSAPGSRGRSFRDVSQSLVGAAGQMATVDVVSQLSDRIPGMTPRKIAGRVADVEGERVVLNIGVHDGLARGDLVKIERFERDVVDPDHPNRVLRRLTKLMAVAIVEEVDDSSSIARILSRSSGDPVAAGMDVLLY